MQFLETKALKALGKKIESLEVESFMKGFKETPWIDTEPTGLLDDTIDFYYKETGVMLMFDKKKFLSNIYIYINETEDFKNFSGFFNLIMHVNATKKSIIKALGKPMRENNIVSNSYGICTPKWIAYDYQQYTLRCAFYGNDDKLAEVNLMTIECTPGRNMKN